jgi:hypothetical protein
MKMKVNNKLFQKEMNNVMEYSLGFLEGAEVGKKLFLGILGQEVVQVLKKYIDTNARMDPSLLHHVYEWYKTGSPAARLFEIQYTVSNLGLSFNSTFSQSKSIANGAKEPFYNKASIMEKGEQVIIRPKRSNVLVFDIDGRTIFTSNDVVVDNPGGSVAGKFEKVFDSFFTQYFTQSFLKASGIFDYLENPVLYKKNLRKGAKIGKAVGVQTGIRWIANAGLVEVE